MDLNPAIEHLRKIKFIGPFPQSVDVLLVSLETALTEAKTKDKDLTTNLLKTLLRINNILVFNTLDDYVKYKGLKK